MNTKVKANPQKPISSHTQAPIESSFDFTQWSQAVRLQMLAALQKKAKDLV